MTEQLVKYMDT
ncbi:hypothetical protein MOE85_21230, partial [Bacillus haynesii]|nr:hypothetical protein [Bacillus haynesii]